MRKIVFLIIGFSILHYGCSRQRTVEESVSRNTLIIWTYDSFVSEWGPGPEVSRVFQEKTGIEIKWEKSGDAGMILSRLLSEGEKADADLIIGIDQNMAGRALGSGLFEAYKPKGAELINGDIILDPEFHLTPMDYGFFAIVYDSETLVNYPQRLEELTDAEYRRSLILIDPRTSSVGLGFFAWIKEVYGSGWKSYWMRLKPSILTITEGWSSAYGLFTRGEAPMVLSYTTSPGYHLEYENSERFKAALFSDGHPLQIEMAGILKGAKNKEEAKAFLDFMLSEDFQSIIPLTNWMYPVLDIALPDSFRVNPKSSKPLLPPAVTEEDLNEWAALF